MVANPALAGDETGAWGNVAYGGNVNPPHNRKGGSGNPPPKGRRAPALSRPLLTDTNRKNAQKVTITIAIVKFVWISGYGT